MSSIVSFDSQSVAAEPMMNAMLRSGHTTKDGKPIYTYTLYVAMSGPNAVLAVIHSNEGKVSQAQFVFSSDHPISGMIQQNLNLVRNVYRQLEQAHDFFVQKDVRELALAYLAPCEFPLRKLREEEIAPEDRFFCIHGHFAEVGHKVLNAALDRIKTLCPNRNGEELIACATQHKHQLPK